MTPNLAWTAACAAALVACGGSSAPQEPPPAPANLEATPGDGVVGLRWDAVPGAEGYTVYWASAPGVTRAGGNPIPTQNTTLNHDGLDNRVTYHYVVTAANGAGEGPESAEVSATPLPAYEPLTVARAGTGGGSVVSAPPAIDCGPACSASLARDSSVTLTATPDATSTFDGWSGDCAGAGDCALLMDDARSVTATFTRRTYALLVARTEGGSVGSAPAGIECGELCAATYDAGTEVTLTATGDAGATFVGWTGACTGTGTCTVTMDSAKSVSARFTFPLTVARSGAGAGVVGSSPAGIGCGATCSAGFDGGTSVTLTATPDATSVFAGWSGACTGTGTCTVPMTAARSVEATFARQTYALSVTRTGGGSVASTPEGIDCGATCQASYFALSVVELWAIPASDAAFAGWSGACTGTGSCTVTMTSAKVVNAVFTYPLSVTRSGTGAGSVSSSPAGISCGAGCVASFSAGTLVVLTASPSGSSTFEGWTGACSGTGACQVTMDQVRSVDARFTSL